MRQYLAAKAAYPDALLFFRMGDFYELFFEDAVVAAKALELTLTSRNKGSPDAIPMAGVPHHASSAYVQRLLDQGFKVAICEQMADPATVKGIVPREVVRVATPAMAYDDSAIDAKKNHFLVAIEVDEATARVGIAALDFSTGELLACEADGVPAALSELLRLDPREVLLGAGTQALASSLRDVLPRSPLRVAAGYGEREEARIALRDRDAVNALLDAVLGPGESARSGAADLALAAAAHCVHFASVCEPGKKLPISRLVPYLLGDTLVLDDAAQRHLELVRTMDGDSGRGAGSLLQQIDRTRTAAGARLLRRRLLAPRTDVAEIRRRLDGVELFVAQAGLRTSVRGWLDKVSDLERLAVKLAVDRIGPRELVALRSSLSVLPALDDALVACRDRGVAEALGMTETPAMPASFVDRVEDVHALLERAIVDEPPVRASEGGVFRDGFDAELDEARTLTRNGQALIVELEGRLREEAQIPSLKLRYTRVFGWYIEVTRSHLGKAPKAWRRKQTVATGERFTCDELDALADKLAHAEDRLASREAELFADLVSRLGAHSPRLRDVSAALAKLDVASALAELAHRDDYARPVVDDSFDLILEDARHPVVERLAAAGHFVPNDVALDASGDPSTSNARLWLVTGPNMAGKSTFMRQVALAVVLAQMGSFVPAKRAKIGVVDRVLTRVGASDNLARGESTFMVEMRETANILRRATRRSLVVLDEIGRGTSTYDGLSIAWAVAEHLHDVVGCRALFATHYHEITELTASCALAENYSVSAREHAGEIVFFHKVQRGAASRSYGVACARLAGVPELVLARARSILDTLEQGASVPSGSKKRVGARKGPQLGLFGGSSDAPAPSPTLNPALEMLRAIDVDRMTPLEALTTLAKLKGMLTNERTFQ
jgi:DNA mismatch repair protein MutS